MYSKFSGYFQLICSTYWKCNFSLLTPHARPLVSRSVSLNLLRGREVTFNASVGALVLFSALLGNVGALERKREGGREKERERGEKKRQDTGPVRVAVVPTWTSVSFFCELLLNRVASHGTKIGCCIPLV